MKCIRRFSLEMYSVCYFLQLQVKRLINSIWQPVRGWSCPFRTSTEFSQTNQHQGQFHTGCQSTHLTRNTCVPHHCIPVITGHRRLDLLQKTQFRRSQWHSVVYKGNLPFFPLMSTLLHGYSPGLVCFEVLSYALTLLYTLVSGLSQSPLPSAAWKPFLMKL